MGDGAADADQAAGEDGADVLHQRDVLKAGQGTELVDSTAWVGLGGSTADLGRGTHRRVDDVVWFVGQPHAVDVVNVDLALRSDVRHTLQWHAVVEVGEVGAVEGNLSTREQRSC